MGVSPKQAMEALGRILRRNPIQMGAMRIDWQKMASLASKAQVPQRLSSLIGENTEQQRGEEGSRIREALLHAKEEEREEIVRTYICEQVARVLGTSAAKLDVDRPLNELGLDSLMAIELKNRIESDLALSLPTRELMEGPTINRLSKAVLNQLGSRASASADASATEISQGSQPETSSPLTCLVPLRAQGTRPALFCIHPAGGQVNIYKNLVDMLPADQPVFGIQSRLLTGAKEEHHSIEDMAIDYAQVIRQQQPNGPYYLLGFSLGGFFAMTIANVMERQGQRVAFVGLVDCDVQWVDPSYPRHLILRNFITEMYGLIQRELGFLQPLAAERLTDEATELSEKILWSAEDQRIEAIINWLTEQKYILGDVPYTVLNEYLSRFVIHIGLIENFQPEMTRAPLFIWRARESLSGINQSDKNWGMYTSETVVEETIEGNHYTVMYRPSVHTLAGQLDKSLQVIQASQTALLT